MKREELIEMGVPEECLDAVLGMHEAELKAATDEVNKQHDENLFNRFLSEEIARAKAMNEKAVMAMLDIDALKGSEDREGAIRQAIDDLVKNEGWLFKKEDPIPPPYATGDGSMPIMFIDEKEAAFRDGIGVQKGGYDG